MIRLLRIAIIVIVGLGIYACGSGNNIDTSGTGDWDLTGTIIFEQAHSNGFHIPQGIASYDLVQDSMTLFAEGIYPRCHLSGEKTVFLQECQNIPGGGGAYYRVVLVDTSGMITPVTPCSLDIPNPTTGVFMLEDLTRFGFVSLSPDESLVAVTSEYDILSEDQSYKIGTALNTMVFDLSGEVFTILENAYDATWLTNGRLLFVNDNSFFLTDYNLKNPVRIDDGGLINGPVNNPAVHPDGEFFVFEYNHQIWRMNIDGSGLEKVLEADRRLRYPAWSPDGTMFVFTVWDVNYSSTLQSLFFYDLANERSHRIDIDHLLETLGEPWGPLSWVN